MTDPSDAAARPNVRPSFTVFVWIFFVSGFAALLYQMIWQRLLAFFGGADVYSVTIIVAAFMAGLGFGNLAGGHVADRLSVAARLRLFAFAELAIAAFAFVSVPLFYDVLYVRLAESLRSPILIAAVLFAILLWPTFFMGMSLPLLAKALTTSTDEAASRIGALYGYNTLGAAVGSLVSVWTLVRAWGFAPTILLGGVLNLCCAAAALLLARSAPVGAADTGRTPPLPAPEGEAPTEATAAPVRAWFLLYGLAGFIALSLEILWFRLLGVMLKSNAFTFATLLALYLAGVGLGSLVGRRRAGRSRHPAAIFLALQSGITLYAGLSVAALALLERSTTLSRLWRYLGTYEAIEIGTALRALQTCLLHPGQASADIRELALLFCLLYGLLPAFLVLPPTMAMGMSFPFLQKTVQTDLGRVGRRVGWLQTANIVGCLAGAICTGLLLLEWIGSAWTLRLLMGLGALFLLLAARDAWPRQPARRRLGYAAALTVSVSAIAATPSAGVLWARLHGTTPERVLFGEDGSGVSLLKQEAEGSPTQVYVNGLGQSWLPYGGVHTFLGALPALLHPEPREVAVIGLGSGDTVFAAGGRSETERVDCIEIVRPQLETLRLLDRRKDYVGLRALLADPRIAFSFADGRAFIMRGSRLYDVIEADALRPSNAYAGNLYSYEYFQLLGRHLRPGGFAVSWGPTPRIRDTFVKAFPHVALFGSILVGSARPIPFDPVTLGARLREPHFEAYYRRAGIEVGPLFAKALANGPVVFGPDVDRSQLTDINTDLFPRDEYLVPRRSRSPGPADRVSRDAR